ncbi:MAG: LemA family protein [Planctomycetaceae bacterium]|nr:LemA family protein [Planctomycetaceae bacterium]
MEGLIVLGIVVLLPLLIVAGMYNSLVGKRNQVHNILGTMDAMLKKRWDLVPNLVATVKGYADHERQLFEKVTEARARAQSGGISDNEKVQTDNLFSQLLGVVRMTVENYPQLKASENFLHLQRTLNELEEQISAARRAYNASVTDYNNAVQMFPTNIIAGMFSFTEKPLFQIEAGERANPQIGKLF